MEGYIKDYRQELQCDVWLMSPLYHRVWQYLKYTVNHAESKIPMKDGNFINIRPGQKLTSYRAIAQDVGWYEREIFKVPNVKTIKEICDWLEKQYMIKIEHGESNNKYTLITLVNWGKYQDKDAVKVTENKQSINSEETESKQSADINKNVKNDKNVNNIYNNIHTCDAPAEKPTGSEEGGAQSEKRTGKGGYTQEFEEFWSHYPKRVEKQKAFRCWTARINKKVNPKDMIFAAINYTKHCEANVTEQRYIKNPSTFLGPDEPYKDYINYFPLQSVNQAKKNNTSHGKSGKPSSWNLDNQREFDKEVEQALLNKNKEIDEEIDVNKMIKQIREKKTEVL